MKQQLSPKSPSVLEGMTLQEVGEVMGITGERVKQVEGKALISLRNQLILQNLKYIDQFI